MVDMNSDETVLIDQRAEHVALDNPGRDCHDDSRKGKTEDDGGPDRKAFRREKVERAHKGEARKQHHRALCKIEHAGCLEDQHEAERDQRIEHAGQQAADQDFAETDRRRPSVRARRDRRRSPPGCFFTSSGRAVGDLHAVVEHHHAVGEVHHHAHVVLDQRDGRAVMIVHVDDEAATCPPSLRGSCRPSARRAAEDRAPSPAPGRARRASAGRRAAAPPAPCGSPGSPGNR